MRAIVVFCSLCWGAVALPRPASADEVAPELETADLRHTAQVELRRLVLAMPTNDQRRLVGIYAAFDDDASDPSAQVACDDDGDYVVVVTEAMLRLAAYLARAATYEEGGASRKVEEYAGFLARAQIPGQRLLPPPSGFYIAERAARKAAYDDRLTEILSFVMARELTHLRAGDLACPNPTATHEADDDVWTAAEKRKAKETAAIVYPGHQPERDQEAIVRVMDVDRTETGAITLLRFFDQLEIERRVSLGDHREPVPRDLSSRGLGRFLPGFVALHPSSAVRLAVVKQAAEEHRPHAER
jgi:hypothetical protein